MRSFGVALFMLLFVVGCQDAAILAPIGTSYINGQSLGTYKNIKSDITELSSDKTRIYIYRPQSFLGAAARPAVIVNGKWIGGTVDPPKTLLTPGSVFIVDSPTQQNKIWLQQDKGGEADNKPVFYSGNGEAIYLRFSMKPTSSYLAIADKSTAKEEIQGLNFMGHFAFSKDLDSVCNVTLPTAKLDYVVISRENAAYTVFVGITQEKLNAAKDQSEDKSSVEIVAWEMFLQGRDKHVKQHITKNEYPNSRVADGIVELIRRFPNNPVGLTWNGGIAITRNDYQHVLDTFQRFQANPAKYDNATNGDQRTDPVNPQGHLGPLLCW